MRIRKYRLLMLAMATLLLATAFLAGCTSNEQEHEDENLAQNHADHNPNYEQFETTDGPDVMPAFLAKYTDSTQELYTEVLKYEDILTKVKCYCGCMDYEDAHENLFRCYILDKNANGVTWTDHGAGCGLCMLELKEVKKLSDEGKSDQEIIDYIDGKYKVEI